MGKKFTTDTGMSLRAHGERLGVDGDDIKVINPVLHIERNRYNPDGYVFTIEDGDEIQSIRIDKDTVKRILKEVIDTF